MKCKFTMLILVFYQFRNDNEDVLNVVGYLHFDVTNLWLVLKMLGKGGGKGTEGIKYINIYDYFWYENSNRNTEKKSS